MIHGPDTIHKAIKLLQSAVLTCLRCLWSNIHQYQERMLLPGSLMTDGLAAGGNVL